LSTTATAASIPRVLHQIWLGRGEMPLHQRCWRRRFAEMNQHWEMRLWTDDNLRPSLTATRGQRAATSGAPRLRDAIGHPAA